MTEPNPQTRDQPARPSADQSGRKTVVVVGPDGRPVGTMPVPSASTPREQAEEEREDLAKLVEQPAKVMRIGSMIKQLLDEVKSAPLDEAGRQRLKEIHQRSIRELEEGLAPELTDELDRLTLPFTEDGAPSEAELRIAQAQLVGWLEGLFHGIQAALVAQQMAARIQLDQMRGRAALPPGVPGPPSRTEERHPGQYL